MRIDERLVACIPTCRDEPEHSFLDATLAGLALQSHLPARVILRDEGRFRCFDKPATRMLWDLLGRRGVETVYLRARDRRGVAHARHELFRALATHALVLWLDDDVVAEPDAVARMVAALDGAPAAGFAQGQKIELDQRRSYQDDINRLHGQTALPEQPFPIRFGDAALLLLRRDALDAVDWSVVGRYALEGLGGEDVAITLMIADKRPGLAVPAAIGWHLSPPRERWRWEPASDALQAEILRGVVSEATLNEALPHLRKGEQHPEQTWDTAAAAYAGIQDDSRAAFLLPVLAARVAPGARVLDLGCGPGHLAARLAPGTGEVLLCDSSLQMRGLALESVRTRSDACRFRGLAPGEPFDRVDLVILSLVLSTVGDDVEALDLLGTARAALAPGGVLVVALPHPCFLIPVIEEDRYRGPLTPVTLDLQEGDAHVHITDWHRPLARVIGLLGRAGLAVVDATEVYDTPEWHRGHAPRFAGKLPQFLVLDAVAR